MAIEITIPRLGWSMDEGIFVQWLKGDGDLITAGDMLFVIEGDKATQEIESFDSGVLCIPAGAAVAGDVVQVGQVMGFLLAEGETPPAYQPNMIVASDPPAAATELAATPVHDPSSNPVVTSTRTVATPRARQTARNLGIDLLGIIGSGRGGRIRERDVIAQADQLPQQAAAISKVSGHLQILTTHRQVIAQRMRASAMQTVPVTLHTKVEAAALVEFRQSLQGADTAPTYNDILVKLTAALLPQCPELNACWTAQGVYLYDEIHLAIAIDTPAGLVAPVIRSVPELTLGEVSQRSHDFIAAARKGTLTSEQQTGGTFTVTNLGMYGIDHFTPVINSSQSAILGIGRIRDEPVVLDNKLVVGKVLSLSLTFDHQVLDGAAAARWLEKLTTAIVNPLNILA
ncbi:MAG: 2-oxo acid dehydrogenase subunit E2 [Planctomycetaceae bacterium]|jgi:pyruvate dehydrogenase E2 component (dihydrolipoamide acetyltransferase)|nr:2-oxo acid dehydrogenase subunit E2 [Planctomycetaceae bacterium]MBT4724808.1 2-oxo acid dehydrogenase subunit E2 [Planctomycetaceae bacterium]MBT4845372.1 2-oxo acid dehydrogenase subunit E2 [Planctomycetaceae bacterium]MBT5124407.1 2-oxo acid dehydrogenase subunit E2 [Planctomycetaceae bacterium]MBT5598470.1 2-oxo acid dehydrogenase subunit E2 [Planctomycetaceae bacterium]